MNASIADPMLFRCALVVGSVLAAAACMTSSPEPSAAEICTDEKDNDGDGATDCDDDDCGRALACPLDGMDGEGEPAGEGEGEGEAGGEGEGEGEPVGEGEGEGEPVGEGEGEPVGEGEGEPGGEGEGEGEPGGEGEGEPGGEGEGEPSPDDVGGRDAPAALLVPGAREHVLGGDDEDCFAFSVSVVGSLFVDIDGVEGICPGDIALALSTSAGSAVPTLAAGGCASLVADIDAGSYVFCAAGDDLGPVKTTATFDGGLVISEVADPANPSSGEARFVEIFNATAVPASAGNYQLRVFSNGSAIAGQTIALTPGGVIPAGGTYVVARSAAVFTATFPDAAAPNQTSGSISSNGNDVYQLATTGAAAAGLDVYGFVGVNGDGQAWEFEDRGARRSVGVTVPTTAFDPAQWTISTTFTPAQR